MVGVTMFSSARKLQAASSKARGAIRLTTVATVFIEDLSLCFMVEFRWMLLVPPYQARRTARYNAVWALNSPSTEAKPGIGYRKSASGIRALVRSGSAAS
jgi:hypothetical protein